MRRSECPRESDVLDALHAGRWEAAAEGELRAHARECPICGDLAEAVGPIFEARDLAWPEARVAPASVVWRRAQLRARREAARRAARPLAAVHAVAAVTVLLVAGALVVWVAPAAGDWAADAVGPLAADVSRLRLPALTVPDGLWWALVIAGGAWLLLAPVAIYFALYQE